ncbi:MAG: S1 family peptidase [Gemmataceae bacterium]|nr:S1 family peptidase [Gemmataceae bacterium]
MSADDVAEWKQKLLGPIQEKIRERAASAEGAAPLRPETRLAVGYSIHKGDRHLELRVQRRDGPAWKHAQTVQDKYPKEVNIAVVESVEVPPVQAVLEHAPYSSGRLTALPKTSPLCIGASVSHRDETAPGSLGAFVRDESGELGIVSCSHVLAQSGQARKRDLIVHPGKGDVKQLANKNRIGNLADYAILSRGGANTLDAAYARLDSDVTPLGNLIPDSVGAPDSMVGERVLYVPNAPLDEDEEVAKVGRTTGYTQGILNAIAVDNVAVVVRGLGLVYFDNCLEVRWAADDRPFTRPGDSGSVVFTAYGQMAVGIHFAGGTANRDGKQFNVSYACDLAAIMSPDLLNLTWVNEL